LPSTDHEHPSGGTTEGGLSDRNYAGGVPMISRSYLAARSVPTDADRTADWSKRNARSSTERNS
jgi:hypothetical protein